jgi:hypothetical protein
LQPYLEQYIKLRWPLILVLISVPVKVQLIRLSLRALPILSFFLTPLGSGSLLAIAPIVAAVVTGATCTVSFASVKCIPKVHLVVACRGSAHPRLKAERKAMELLNLLPEVSRNDGHWTYLCEGCPWLHLESSVLRNAITTTAQAHVSDKCAYCIQTFVVSFVSATFR